MGPRPGSGVAFFAFSFLAFSFLATCAACWVGMFGASRSICNGSPTRDTRRVVNNPRLARLSMTKCRVSGRRANHLPVLEHPPGRINSIGSRPVPDRSPSITDATA